MAERNCPQCGKPVKEHVFFCPSCGTDIQFDKQQDNNTDNVQNGSDLSTLSTTKIKSDPIKDVQCCPYCHSQILNGAIKCCICGEWVDNESQSQFVTKTTSSNSKTHVNIVIMVTSGMLSALIFMLMYVLGNVGSTEYTSQIVLKAFIIFCIVTVLFLLMGILATQLSHPWNAKMLIAISYIMMIFIVIVAIVYCSNCKSDIESHNERLKMINEQIQNAPLPFKQF